MFYTKKQLSLLVISIISLAIPFSGVFFYDYYLAKSLNHLVTIEPTNFFLPEELMQKSKMLFFLFLIQFLFLSVMMSVFIRKNFNHSSSKIGEKSDIVQELNKKNQEIESLQKQIDTKEETNKETYIKKTEPVSIKENLTETSNFSPEVKVETKEIVKTVEVEVAKEIVVYPDKTPISVSLVASRHLERLVKEYENRYYEEGFQIKTFKTFIKNANYSNYTIIDNLEGYLGDTMNLDSPLIKIEN